MIVMAHTSTDYPPSEAACYAAVKFVGVPDSPDLQISRSPDLQISRLNLRLIINMAA